MKHCFLSCVLFVICFCLCRRTSVVHLSLFPTWKGCCSWKKMGRSLGSSGSFSYEPQEFITFPKEKLRWLDHDSPSLAVIYCFVFFLLYFFSPLKFSHLSVVLNGLKNIHDQAPASSLLYATLNGTVDSRLSKMYLRFIKNI